MVSAAVCQPLAARPRNIEPRRGRLVEMEGLRIEFGGEGLDPLLLDPQTPGSEFLSCGKIFEVTLGHSGVT